jgi:hypothetical protein
MFRVLPTPVKGRGRKQIWKKEKLSCGVSVSGISRYPVEFVS